MSNEFPLGREMCRLWLKRQPKLSHNIAVAAYALSPVAEISAHVRQNLDVGRKQQVENVLKKLFVPMNLTDADEEDFVASMLDEFWTEYNDFDSRQGKVFGPDRKFIWSAKDITANRSHI